MVTVVNFYLQPFHNRTRDLHLSSTMGSLEKNGSAVENIDGIAKAEKTDPEKGGNEDEKTFGVEKVIT